ncbi:putative bifunctional diguanylate cyclase/phosphodiesterase [Insolitispirillum peregrinum]|uniref:putative bifunctional diguanylate cyclase/phosphodiesterase n=1 Tax=Insolitispirillum peregrinum TaxID=80876 RepID=UPI003610DD3A
MRPIRFGIRARLWLALMTVASMTLVASLVAWVTNDHSSQTTTQMVEGEVPAIVALSRLGQHATQLIATAPGVLFVDDQADLHEQWRRTAAAEEAMMQAVQEVQRQQGATSPVLASIERTAGRTSVQLQILLSAMEHSLALRARYRIQTEQIDVLQQEYRVLVGLLSSDVANDMAVLSDANRIMAALAEVWQVGTPERMSALEERVRGAFDRLDSLRPALIRSQTGAAELLPLIDRLRTLALADGSIFDLKRRDIQARQVAADRLATIQVLATALDRDIRTLMSASQERISVGHADVMERLGQSKLILLLSSSLSLVAAMMVAWRYVGTSVVGRLQTLADSMRAIAAGNLAAPIPTGGHDEVSDMGRALVVFRDALAHVRHVASHDPLTGLANRRLFEEKLSRDMQRAEACGTVIAINLRGFRDINNTFGHQVGDQLLLAMADRLRWAARAQDLAARLGSDDFVLLVPGLVEPEEISAYLDGLHKVLAAPVPLDVIEMEAQPVLGIARYPHDGLCAADVLHNADLAMTSSKDAMTPAVAFYNSSMGEALHRRKAIRSDLRQAIEDGHLELHYQPKVEMQTGLITGMEALVRWQHPKRGRISPMEFIPVAEQSGLILPLGTWVLQEGCRQAQAWSAAGLGDLRVAINMSPVQVLCQDVVGIVAQTLEDTGLPPNLLEIEITEGVLMQEETKAMQRLRAMRDLGVHLAIDDFGTGYSSLSYLKKMPVSCLKIDQSFVRGLMENEEDARLSRVIIGMAHDFGLEVVAEGIETLEHADFLRHEGCDLGQGYYFAKPLEQEAFERLLASPPPWQHQPVGMRSSAVPPWSQTPRYTRMGA